MIHTTGLWFWCEYMKVVTSRNGRNLFSRQIDLLFVLFILLKFRTKVRRRSRKTNKARQRDVANDRKLSYSATCVYVEFLCRLYSWWNLNTSYLKSLSSAFTFLLIAFIIWTGSIRRLALFWKSNIFVKRSHHPLLLTRDNHWRCCHGYASSSSNIWASRDTNWTDTQRYQNTV